MNAKSSRLRYVLIVMLLVTGGCRSIFGASDVRIATVTDSPEARPSAPASLSVTATNVGYAVASWDRGSSSCQLTLVVRVQGKDVYAPHDAGVCTMDLAPRTLAPGESRTENLRWSGHAQLGITRESVVLLPPGTYEVRGAAGRQFVGAPILITVRAE